MSEPTPTDIRDATSRFNVPRDLYRDGYAQAVRDCGRVAMWAGIVGAAVVVLFLAAMVAALVWAA